MGGVYKLPSTIGEVEALLSTLFDEVEDSNKKIQSNVKKK